MKWRYFKQRERTELDTIAKLEVSIQYLQARKRLIRHRIAHMKKNAKEHENKARLGVNKLAVTMMLSGYTLAEVRKRFNKSKNWSSKLTRVYAFESNPEFFRKTIMSYANPTGITSISALKKYPNEFGLQITP